jgi:hypothetical protein
MPILLFFQLLLSKWNASLIKFFLTSLHFLYSNLKMFTTKVKLKFVFPTIFEDASPQSPCFCIPSSYKAMLVSLYNTSKESSTLSYCMLSKESSTLSFCKSSTFTDIPLFSNFFFFVVLIINLPFL